jgi:hypothetical protein
VAREVEWDDYERDKMLALDMHDSHVHHTGCGFHEDLATDLNNLFEPVVSVCPLCASLELQGRQVDADDEKARKALKEGEIAPLPSDGRHISTRMLSPLEAEERRSTAPDPHRARARRVGQE